MKLVLILLLLDFEYCIASQPVPSKQNAYYFDITGSDNNNGTKNSPWKTLSQLNKIHIFPGDAVYFQGGQCWIQSDLVIKGSPS